MEGGRGELWCWDKLSPNVLGLIFIKLSLLEILTVIPSVCKSWGEVVSSPYCWHEINIKEWSKWSYRHWSFETKHIDRMLQMLITRSCGTLRKLSVSKLSNDSMLSFIADHASCLQHLELPGSRISDSIVEQVAEKLSTITFLDISHCTNIGVRALSAIGNHCKSLVGLRRVMYFQEEDEAHAIATTMTKLKNLELASPTIWTGGVVEILSSCHDLEYLDVRGCPYVMLDKRFLEERCSNGLKVLLPINITDVDASYWVVHYWSRDA